MNTKITANAPDETQATLTFKGTAGEMRDLSRALRGFAHPNSKAVNDFLSLTLTTISEKLTLENDE